MRQFGLIGAAALLLLAAACATHTANAPTTNTPTTSAPASSAPAAAPQQTYSQAVETLIAATRTRGDYQNTTMSEARAPCTFFYEIAPGRQSIVAYMFDVRRLNLNAVSVAEGQVAQSPNARRIACAKEHGRCGSYVGMPMEYVDIAAPTPEDVDRALGAMRQLQSLCSAAPPPAPIAGSR